jgi:hypothetical protein
LINSFPVTAESVFQELKKQGHIQALLSNQEWRLQISQKVNSLKTAFQIGQSTISKEALDEFEGFLPTLDEYAHWLVDNKTYL